MSTIEAWSTFPYLLKLDLTVSIADFEIFESIFDQNTTIKYSLLSVIW
jgi:hypothetical protein